MRLIADSFAMLPLRPAARRPKALDASLSWGSQMLAGAVRIALPASTALLVANIAFGVMSRAAPTLNLFAVGLPAGLLIGFLILLMNIGHLSTLLAQFLQATLDDARRDARRLSDEPWPKTTPRNTIAQSNRVPNGSTTRAARRSAALARARDDGCRARRRRGAARRRQPYFAEGMQALLSRGAQATACGAVRPDGSDAQLFGDGVAVGLQIIAPLFVACLLASVLGSVALGGWSFSFESLTAEVREA